MKNQIFIQSIILILVLACSSCSKQTGTDHDPGTTITIPVKPEKSIRIKSWTGPNFNNTYTYNAQNQCVLISKDDHTKVTYEYTGNQASQNNYDKDGLLTARYVFDLNKDGLAIRQTRPGFSDLDMSITYNQDKRVLKSVYVQNGHTYATDYFYTNGNADSIRFTVDGKWTNSIVNTFYSDQINTIDLSTQGVGFHGVDNKNLLKTELYRNLSGQLPLTNYTYEYDAQGRVIKLIRTRNAQTDVETISYIEN